MDLYESSLGCSACCELWTINSSCDLVPVLCRHCSLIDSNDWLKGLPQGNVSPMQGLLLLRIKVLQSLLALLIGLFPTRRFFANGKKGELDDTGGRVVLKQGRRHDGFAGTYTTLDTSPVGARRKHLFLSLKANNVHDPFHFRAICHEFFIVVFFELNHGREIFGMASIVTYMGLPHYDGVVVSHGDGAVFVRLRVDESMCRLDLLFFLWSSWREGGDVSVAREPGERILEPFRFIHTPNTVGVIF